MEKIEHETIDMPLTEREPIDKKKKTIEGHFHMIMNELGLDMDDDSLKDTPSRVAKMFVDEIFTGLDEENFPKISTFENKYGYDQMLIETNIEVKSVCEHHFQPILGVAHIAYIPKDRVIGLSKLNRVVEHFARRPQVQERMTKDVLTALQKALGTEDVAVAIDAKHFCVIMRGVKHNDCITRTTQLGGSFKSNNQTRNEFLSAIGTAK